MLCNPAPASSLTGSSTIYIVHREKINSLPTLKFKEFTFNASGQSNPREKYKFNFVFLVKIFSDKRVKNLPDLLFLGYWVSLFRILRKEHSVLSLFLQECYYFALPVQHKKKKKGTLFKMWMQCSASAMLQQQLRGYRAQKINTVAHKLILLTTPAHSH